MIKKKQEPPTLDRDLVFDHLWEQRNHSFGSALGLLLRPWLDSLLFLALSSCPLLSLFLFPSSLPPPPLSDFTPPPIYQYP